MTIFLLQLFTMDIQHMTPADWAGVMLNLISAIALSIAYYKVFHPQNKAPLESHRYHLIDHDRETPCWGNERRQTRIRNK